MNKAYITRLGIQSRDHSSLLEDIDVHYEMHWPKHRPWLDRLILSFVRFLKTLESFSITSVQCSQYVSFFFKVVISVVKVYKFG